MIQRLSFAELSPELQKELAPRVERLGYLGEMFQVAGHQPAALAAFHQLTAHLRAALPDDAAEIVALTVATVTGNDYERHQHEQLALKLGLGDAWIRGVEALGDGGLVQRTVLALLEDRGRGASEVVDQLAAERGDAFAVAVVLLTGRYLMHTTFVHALGLEPPVPSPLSLSGTPPHPRA